MSKFTNIKMQETINTLTNGFKDTYSNPYYAFISGGKTVVTYLSQSKELSTLDEGNLKAYADRGKLSPIKFNRINNVILYGMDKIQLAIQLGDFGLEADDISGEATMLPGLEPKANDYFIIDHYENTYLFKVTSVDLGTPEVENIYKISYKYVKNHDDNMLSNVVGEYQMIVNNIGTEYKVVMEKTEFNFVNTMELLIDKLREYYCDLFYNTRVESFILFENYQFIYDPVLTEFIIRNDILDRGQFICYTQQICLERTFSLEYDRSIFKYIEYREKNKIDRAYTNVSLNIIDQYMSILSMRQEQYYRAKYINDTNDTPSYIQTMNAIEPSLITAIIENDPIDMPDHIENILINYMNGKDITKSDIDTLEEVEYMYSKRLFYLIPVVIHILNHNINKIINTNKRRK